jgi:hypothetical protein
VVVVAAVVVVVELVVVPRSVRSGSRRAKGSVSELLEVVVVVDDTSRGTGNRMASTETAVGELQLKMPRIAATRTPAAADRARIRELRIGGALYQ